MSYRIMFVLSALIAFAAGAAFLIVPSILIKQFGVDDYASTQMVARFFGTALLALGLVLWFAKDVPDGSAQKGMGIALLVGAVAGLVVTLVGSVGGALRTNAWIAMLIYAVTGLGFAYLVFLKPGARE